MMSDSIVRMKRWWGLGLGCLLSLMTTSVLRAQEAVAPPVPAPTVQPMEPAAVLGDVAQPMMPEAPYQPPVLVENQPGLSPLGVIGASIFGKQAFDKTLWHPLSLDTFFTEGWDEPFIWPPAGSGGAARGGWINSFDGTFFRAWFVDFIYTNNLGGGGNQYIGNYALYVPFNRRFELRLDVPFIVSNQGGPRNNYHGNAGDVTISPRFLLSASQDVSQVLAINIRTPTGDTVNGNGVTSLTAQYQFWWNIAGPWITRGGTGVTVPTNDVGARTSYFVNWGVGQYFARENAAFFKEFYWYLVANVNTTLDNRGPNSTFVGLTPGIRFAISEDKLWHFLAAVEVPVTGPKSFDYQPIFLILKDY